MPYEYDGGDDTDGDDGREEDVVVLYEVPPVTAQEGAGPYEEQRPGDGADDGEDDEFPERIAGDAGREGNERADAGQAAADDDGNAAVLVEQVFGHAEFTFVEEDVFAIL